MLITVNNQQPTILNNSYLDPIANDFDSFAIIRDQIVNPLFKPINSAQPITVTCDKNTLSNDDITSVLLNCCDDYIDPDNEDCMKEIFRQTLIYYDKVLPVQSVYAVQAGKKLGLPMPSPRVIYLPTDVTDAAKQFLGGQLSKDGFFANLAFYTKVSTFGYYFTNDDAWNKFKTWFAAEIAKIQNNLSNETIQLCHDLQNIRLNKLTEGFVLRNDTDQNNDPYSFARIFIYYLIQYEQMCKQSGLPEHTAGCLPFSFMENFCPCSAVIVNIEKHAHAHPNEIQNEWDIIKSCLMNRPRILSLNKIQSLTVLQRMAKKLSQAGFSTKDKDLYKSATFKFRKTAPTFVDFTKFIINIYKRAAFVQSSENSVRFKKLTFQRPSRREPDNPDRQGITSGIKYKPDLHLYLDCSGSISEREYMDAIKACIRIAKRLNINLYFTSFSHVMSKTCKLPMEGKSEKEIYKIFRKIPKVGGGTDYEQIWHCINRSKELSRRVSIVITDFQYHAPNHYVKHPRFLYYAPISAHDWNRIIKDAKTFAKTMLGNCPVIRKHILM